MPYRLEHITTAERADLACLLLTYAGQYGLVTHLAGALGTSRQFLYRLRDTARDALEQALAARPVGRPGVDQRLHVDRVSIERSVLVLSQVAHASVRGIQECLTEILGLERSVGWIEGVLQDAAQRAQGVVAAPRHPVAAVADEIFAGERPVVEVVDHHSGLILALEPVDARDETTWGCTLLDVAARGVRLASLVADGAEGLRAGAAAVGLPAPRLDHWHTLRDLGRIGRSLEAEAYRRLETAERSRRAREAEEYRLQHGRRPRRGRPLKAATDAASVQAAAQVAAVAIQRADATAWVLAAVRDALRPVDPRTGRVRQASAVAADLQTAATLLREVGGRATSAATLLDGRAAGLSAYLTDLDAALAGPLAVLGPANLAFVAWAWQHRHDLALANAAEAWPQDPTVAQQVWAALDGAVRASGMVENLNSVLAPHRAAHRGLPPPILAVFRVYHNHRVVARGQRAGSSPLDRAGHSSPHWLDALGYGRTAPLADGEFLERPRQTVTTLAA
jgi:hypothetical protein